MPSAEDNVLLLWQILQQKHTDGQLAGIDWNPIATALGLEKPAAAQLRWSRLKKELSASDGVMATKATPVKKSAAPKVPKAKKKEKDANEALVKKGANKKRKLEQSKDEDDEIDQAASNKDADEEIEGQSSPEASPEVELEDEEDA